MKLKQRLAAVMATALVVTSIPVISMAASTNTMTTPVKVVPTTNNNKIFQNASSSGALQVKFTGARGTKEVFYLTLENAEWNRLALASAFDVQTTNSRLDSIPLTSNEYNINYQDPLARVAVPRAAFLSGTGTAVGGAIEFENDYTLKVTLPTVNKDDVMVFPLLVQDIVGEAKVKVDSYGSGSSISRGEYVFASTAEKKLTFEVGDLKAVYEKGNIADISFSETFRGAFAGRQTAYIEFELKDADYEFDFGIADNTYRPLDNRYVKLAQGFLNKPDIMVEYKIDSRDRGVCTFRITGPATNGDSIGKITLQNLPVRNKEKNISTGQLLMDIANANGTDFLANARTNVIVADVSAYSNYIMMKDSKPVDCVAGRTEKIEFIIGENVADSFIPGREFELTLNNDAHFNYAAGQTLYTSNNPNTTIVKDQTKAEGENIVSSIRVDSKDNNKLIVKLNDKLNTRETRDKMKLELEVCVPVVAKDDEKITLTASGRALEGDISTTALNVVNPFTVKIEPLTVKVGLQDQVGGKVTIEETEREMFMKGDMYLAVVDPATGRAINGVTFYGKDFVDFSVNGDIKKADLDRVNGNGVAKIQIKRQSSSASTLELKDFHVTVDRSVPEGKYDLVLYGSAIDEHSATGRNYFANDTVPPMKDRAQRELHQLTIKDFLIVGTPNTQDLSISGLRKGTVEFVIGTSKYTVNGVDIAMDAMSYIQDPGFTMVPVRYVAEAFGIPSQDILFSNSTVTILTGARTVQLQNNSDIAIVNGAQVKMGTKVVIKDGRTYAPIGEVARILGLKTGWDNTTKTATFTS